jgi:AP-2 complex subunit alpha
MPSGMKGLTSFVSDIRNCQTKDAERKRVEKELAKIRVKFSSNGDKTLSGYDRKKYVWKLLYAFMLGYEIDFGHIQAVNLCSSTKYSEKLAGYLACALLLSDSPEILRLIVNVCKADLQSPREPICALALHTLANVGGPEFAENLFTDVARIFSPESSASAYIRKKAALCLLRLHRRDQELLVPAEWCPRISAALEQKDLGLVNSTVSLLIGILETLPVSDWSDCLRPLVLQLSSLVVHECPQPYMYYTVPAPWLQVKMLRAIQFFSPNQIDGGILVRITDILGRILGTATTATASPTKPSPKVDPDRLNKLNAENAILFEAINVVIHLGQFVDREIRRSAANILGGYISSPEANTRYLGLESMARLAHNVINEDVITAASEHKLFDKFKSLIASQLHETDISVRRQALTLLYVICDKGNWQGIVDELLAVLSVRDAQLEEELVLKIAILAEANAPDPTWYVDVVFKMFEYAPDSVGEEVWYRAVQIVVNSGDEVALHAAHRAYESIGGTSPKLTYPHDSMMRLSVYLLGEFGHHLVQSKQVTSLRLVELIRKHFARMSPRCKGIALMAFAKILNASPSNKALRDEVSMYIESLKDSSDPDLQQRSCELMFLINKGSDALLEQVLAIMPPLTGGVKDNPLVARLRLQVKTRAATRQALEVAASGRQVPRVRSLEDSSDSSSGSSDSE